MNWANCALLAASVTVSSAAIAEDVVGLVFPIADVQLSVPVAGVVQVIQVSLGQKVRMGQPILRLENEAQRLEYKRRSLIADDFSALESAEERYQAVGELAAMAEKVAKTTASISKEELLKVKLDLLSARGSAKQLESQKVRERVEAQIASNELQLRTLTAPLSGEVVALHVDAGEWAKPGDDIIRLVDSSQVELRLNMSPHAAKGLKKGRTLQASFETTGASLTSTGKVSFVSPLADASSGLIDVRVVFDNKQANLRPGTKAVVHHLPIQTAH